MDGIAPGAETSLRAHLIEVETCWLEVRCGTCRSATMLPCRLLLHERGADAEVGACVSRLSCKRCKVPLASVRLKEQPNDVHPSGGAASWSRLLIDRTTQASGDFRKEKTHMLDRLSPISCAEAESGLDA